MRLCITVCFSFLACHAITLTSQDRGITAFQSKDNKASVVVEVDDVITELWEGHDIDLSLYETKLQGADKKVLGSTGRRKTQHNLANEKNPASRKMVLLGPFDAGSHILLQTLRDNYRDEVHKACAWDRILIDDDRFSHCRVWKHGLNISDSDDNQGGGPLYTALARQGLQLSDVVVVMLVRNPLSMLASWKKAAYDLRPCANRQMYEYDQPCKADGMTWKGAGQHDHTQAVQFLSTADAYNRYIRMYQRIQEDGRVHKALLVAYEDMVLSPADVVDAIAEAVGWPHLASVTHVDAPAKEHGAAVGRERALQKLQDRSWLNVIPEDGRRAICQGLDSGFLTDMVDNRYVSEKSSRSYFYDCEGYV